MLWSEETDEKISDKTMEEDYFERFFYMLGSVVAEDRELLVQQQTPAT